MCKQGTAVTLRPSVLAQYPREKNDFHILNISDTFVVIRDLFVGDIC